MFKSRSLLAIAACCALLAPRELQRSAADRLAAAIQSGTAAQLISQLRQGADPNWRFANGETPLAFAILTKHYRKAQLLITHGANPDVLDHGMTMLSLIAQERTCPVATIRALLAAGADPDQRNKLSSSTPLLSALQSGAQACAQVLIAHGASITATDAAGQSALGAAAMGSSHEIVAQLIGRGADVNGGTAQHTTPLMWAALRRPDPTSSLGESVIELLLRHGADPCLRDEHGMTAADYARQMAFTERASRLAAACSTWHREHPRHSPSHGP
ncbi:MAG: hypothetical protein HKM03_10345 [Steroidobacteraceae bacterium]|nr:hypothetical protein [Steroidobacteraceae bacterium]